VLIMRREAGSRIAARAVPPVRRALYPLRGVVRAAMRLPASRRMISTLPRSTSTCTA